MAQAQPKLVRQAEFDPRQIMRIALYSGERSPQQAFAQRSLILPVQNPATTWQEVYQFFYGTGPVPMASYDIWFGCPPEVDRQIKDAFEPLWNEATSGGLMDWEDEPKSCLAKMLLVDQYSRHMFRSSPKAFLHDELGSRLADRCVAHMAAGAQFHIEEALLFAWPWMHAESYEVALKAERWMAVLVERAKGTPYYLRMRLHQYGCGIHVDVVRRFGRYPHRNRLLERETTPAEADYLRDECGIWALDQWPEYRGGTRRYKRGTAKYTRGVLRHFAQQGDTMLIAQLSWAYFRHYFLAGRA
ncbi:MAG: DUF924 family protein [Myxococcota bacterium]